MGESALKNYMKSAKHDVNMKAAVSNRIKNFLVPSVGESSVNPTSVDPTQSQSSGLDGVCKKHELVTDAEILHHYRAAAELTASTDDYAEKAEASSDLTWIMKSNSLRKTAKSKTQEILNIGLEVQKNQYADDSDSSSDIIRSEADEGSSDSEHESDDLNESSVPESEDDEGSLSSDGEFSESTVESSEEEEDDPSESVDDVFGDASEAQEESSEETEEGDVNEEEFTEPPRDSEIDSDET
ncbi:hypothetical protein HPB47_025260 [Ixodes persulcatus]|uniref:Uncharacterized protein n=1 Tax=Ixodes persulcatus TaxID=34615 RepID=A0AC60Q1Z8_IXOPE|nr:hypothetical protein HPB47_025260 [Ixodes persulcatus]